MDPCRACGSPLTPFGTAVALGRHEASFDRCSSCGLVAAHAPDWLDEAYESAITALDIGLLQRCRDLALLTRGVLRSEGLAGGRVLDWAGGYGTLTRTLRDAGIDCWHHDPSARTCSRRTSKALRPVPTTPSAPSRCWSTSPSPFLCSGL